MSTRFISPWWQTKMIVFCIFNYASDFDGQKAMNWSFENLFLTKISKFLSSKYEGLIHEVNLMI